MTSATHAPLTPANSGKDAEGAPRPGIMGPMNGEGSEVLRITPGKDECRTLVTHLTPFPYISLVLGRGRGLDGCCWILETLPQEGVEDQLSAQTY